MSAEDIQKISDYIKTVIKEDKSKGTKDQFSQNLSMAKFKEYFQKKYPGDSEEEIMVRILDHIKNQFFKTFPIQASKNEDESMKTSSSKGSMDSANAFDCLAGEAQAEEEGPSQEELWDALISSVPSQVRNSSKEKRSVKN